MVTTVLRRPLLASFLPASSSRPSCFCLRRCRFPPPVLAVSSDSPKPITSSSSSPGGDNPDEEPVLPLLQELARSIWQAAGVSWSLEGGFNLWDSTARESSRRFLSWQLAQGVQNIPDSSMHYANDNAEQLAKSLKGALLVLGYASTVLSVVASLGLLLLVQQINSENKSE